MNINKLAGGALLAFIWCSGSAGAFESTQAAYSKPSFESVYGTALPPVGFIAFCSRHADDCRAPGGNAMRLLMTSERWNLLSQVNAYVNGKIAPISDEELYGEPERWEYPTDAGDCEDYVLLKKRYLEGLGFPPEALLITVVLDEKGERLLSFSSRLSSAPHDAYQALSTADAKFPEVTLSTGEKVTMSYGQYRAVLATNRSQIDRRASFLAHYGTYAQSLNYLRKYCDFIPASDMDMILGRNAEELYFSIQPAGIAKEPQRA